MAERLEKVTADNVLRMLTEAKCPTEKFSTDAIAGMAELIQL